MDEGVTYWIPVDSAGEEDGSDEDESDDDESDEDESDEDGSEENESEEDESVEDESDEHDSEEEGSESEDMPSTPPSNEASRVTVAELDNEDERFAQEFLPQPPPSPPSAPRPLPSSATIRQDLEDNDDDAASRCPPPSPRPSPRELDRELMCRPPAQNRPSFGWGWRPPQDRAESVPVEGFSNLNTGSPSAKSSGSRDHDGFRMPNAPASQALVRRGSPLHELSQEESTDDSGISSLRRARGDTPMPDRPAADSGIAEADDDDDGDEDMGYDEDLEEEYLALDSMSELVPTSEPSQSKEARLVRMLMPLFRTNDPQDGTTTYGFILRNRQMTLYNDDGRYEWSRPFWGISGHMNGRLRVAQGSRNGHYRTEHRIEFNEMATNSATRRYAENEFFEHAMNVLEHIQNEEKKIPIDRLLRFVHERTNSSA